MFQGIENLAHRKSSLKLLSFPLQVQIIQVGGCEESHEGQVIFKTRELPSKSPQSNFLETSLSGISRGAFEIKPS